MSFDLATLTQAAVYVPFLNWHHIYCSIISVFGSTCTTTDIVVPDVGGVVDIATTTLSGNAGFWSWLWPFGASSSVDAATATSTAAADVGFWAGMVAVIPEPIMVVFAVLWTVLSFLWGVFSALSYAASALLLVVLIIALGGLLFLRLKEWNVYGVLPPRTSKVTYGRGRWQDLLDAAMSVEPKHWRESIVAADGILGELLTKLGYRGSGTSEQLRTVPEGAFVTLPQAWEAHRIRNFVSHRGSNFILTQREAFRVMKLYEQVFEEFDFI